MTYTEMRIDVDGLIDAIDKMDPAETMEETSARASIRQHLASARLALLELE